MGVQIQRILDNSTILQAMLAEKQIGIVGGGYNLATAQVEFPESYRHFEPDKSQTLAA